MTDQNALELDESDFPDAASFLCRVFGGRPDECLRAFKHWWEDNPAWNPMLPRGWIIRSAGRDVIAFTKNIPFRYRIGGAESICCVTGSTAVDERWRGRGLSKIVGKRFVDQPNISLLVGTGSTHVAHNLWLSLGMKALDRSWPIASYCIPGSIPDLLNEKLQNRLPRNLMRIGSSAAKHGYEVIASLTRGTANLRIHKADWFESKYDSDLSACSASAGSTFPIRDVSILNWLYFGTPSIRESRVVLVARCADHLVGYVAMKHQRSSLLVLECRTSQSDWRIARQLFWAARDYAAQHGINYVRVWRYTPMIDRAVPAVFRLEQRSMPMPTYCFKANVAIRETDWEATPGDGDISLD